jgi:acetyl-CoA carboxylase carboxyl transferase subunit alpha
MANLLKGSLNSALRKLCAIPLDRLVDRRYDKFRKIGMFEEATVSA